MSRIELSGGYIYDISALYDVATFPVIIDVQRLSQAESCVVLQIDLRVHHIIGRETPHARHSMSSGQIVKLSSGS